MRVILLLSATLLAACAGQPSLEDLTGEALLTGDWSKVERRERALSRNPASGDKLCPLGLTYYCEELGSASTCACLPAEVLAGKVVGP